MGKGGVTITLRRLPQGLPIDASRLLSDVAALRTVGTPVGTIRSQSRPKILDHASDLQRFGRADSVLVQDIGDTCLKT